jgi:rifampicin phosphotransferase
MPLLVLSSLEASSAGSDRVGGKASGLAWMSRCGLPVPPWFVIPVEVTERLLRESGVGEEIRGALGSLSAGSGVPSDVLEALRARIEAIEPFPNLVHAVERGFASLGVDREVPFVAVRSSAVGEDSAEASFAGQFDSFLYVRGTDQVMQAVLKCMASALSDRAVDYRLRHGMPVDALRIAVVVQEMIPGEASGVLFTAHPATGSRSHAVVSAAIGLGEGVVSGRVDADEYVARLDGAGPIEVVIGPQDEAAVRGAEGGTRYVQLEPAPRTERVLSDEAVREIVALGARAAVVARRPLDIEWTRAGGRVWIVQARPITALPPPQEGAGEQTVWDNSNIQESYAGVTTPLTFSFARRAYATVYRQTMRAMRLPESVIAAHAHVLDNLLGLIRGRVYYNINNWYRGLLLLPGFGRNKADMEQMMGLQDPVDLVQDEVLSVPTRLARAPGLLLLMARLLRRFGRMDGLVESFHRDFRTAYEAVDRPSLHTRSVPELVALSRRLNASMLERWSVPILNDFFVMMMSGRVRRAIARAGFEQPDLVLSGLLSGLDGLESTEPTHRLLDLCDAIRNDAELARLIADLPDERLPAAVEAADSAFWRRCEAYIDEYGDRTAGELKLETVTPREDPGLLFGLLRGLLERPDLRAETLRIEARALRTRTEQEVAERLSRGGALSLLRKRRLRAALDGFRRGVRHRESTRMQRTRMFGLFRSIYLEIGRQLHGFGALDEARDILYLTVEEIEQYVDGTSASADLAGICRARKAEFAAYEAADMPHHFMTWGVPHADKEFRYPHVEVADVGSVLNGIGCYPGLVEAPAVVVLDPSAGAEVAGRILCAVRTDPGWAPLFPQAAGLLVERGSALSHSAVVARELGIPCVVGLPGLTRRVQTGDLLRMDGGLGRVELPETAGNTGEEEAAA